MTLEVINGVSNHFGRRNVDNKRPLYLPTGYPVKSLVVPFNYDDLPTASAQALTQKIPAYALIHSSYVVVDTPFAGGTSYTIGLQEADGTEIDNDGLDGEILLAAMTPKGTWIAGDGALIGAGIGSAEATATGTFTAGQGKIIVNYMEYDLPDKV
jgi:hypothetical protein